MVYEIDPWQKEIISEALEMMLKRFEYAASEEKDWDAVNKAKEAIKIIDNLS